jgi:hypothetical protein
MKTVAERMADYFAGYHPTMPGSGKTAEAVDAARCLKDSAHTSMMTSVPRPGKTTAAANSAGHDRDAHSAHVDSWGHARICDCHRIP